MRVEDGGSALPFVVFDRGKGYSIAPEAETFLATLENRPLAPIVVAGKYRTGKSYLFNKLLGREELGRSERKAGFAVGDTVNACTRGIWLWSRTICQSEGEQSCELLLLDTEGMGGVGEGQNHDARIVLIALLLSSVFVYNCIGAIDEGELQTVALVTNMAREVRRGDEAELDDSEIAETFPAFIWLLRDFSLQLVDARQCPLSPADYLEAALAPLKGNSETVEGKNRTRRQFKHFFPRRDCLTLVRPVERECDLQRLEELSPEELRPEFNRNLDRVRRAVFGAARRKTARGTPIDGPRLLALARAYVNAVNNGRAPTLDLVWEYLISGENRKVVAALTERFLALSIRRDEVEETVSAAKGEFRIACIGKSAETAETEKRFLADLRERLLERVERDERDLRTAARESARAELDALKLQIIAGELAIGGLAAALESAEARVRRQFNAVEPINEFLQKHFARRRAELEALIFSGAEAAQRRRADALERRLEAAAAERTASDAALRERVEAIGAERDAAIGEQTRLGALLRQSEEALRARNAEIDCLSQIIAAKQNEIRSETENGERFRAEFDAAQNEIEKLSEKISAIERDEKCKNALVAQRENAFRHEIERLHRECEEMEIAFLAEKQRTNDLNERKTDENATVSSLKERINKFEETRRQFDAAIQVLKGEKAALEVELETVHRAYEEQRRQSLSLLDAIGAKIENIALKRRTETGEVRPNRSYESFQRALRESIRPIPSFAAPPRVAIGEAFIGQSRADGAKAITEYEMRVQRGDRRWNASRTFRQFCELLGELEVALPQIAFPKSCVQLWNFINSLPSILERGNVSVEERRGMLQKVIDDLCEIDCVANHLVFARFIADPILDESGESLYSAFNDRYNNY